MNTNSSKTDGFTLIEVLIVVAIIAILASIAVPNLLEAQARSKVSAAHADLRTMATAIEAYSVDYGRPPFDGEPGFTFYGWVNALSQMTTPVAYMTTLPHDQFQAFVTEPTRPGHTHYIGRRHVYDYSTAYWNEVGIEPFMTETWREMFGHSAWKMSSPGPDGAHTFGLSEVYDPTNGTISFGDLIRSMAGSAEVSVN